jgi:homospermidine synthase
MKNPMQPIQKCDKVAKQLFFEITMPYLGKFDTNYNTFKNVENFKCWFFQRTKFCKKKLLNLQEYFICQNKIFKLINY